MAPNSSASGAPTNHSSVTWVVTVGMLVITSTNISPRVIRYSQRSSTISTSKPCSLKWWSIFSASPVLANTSTSLVGRSIPV